ncbi:MAG: hypothetical protein ACI8PT_003652 [Gammaproteobacteria bacterium]|jgi:hypothetical protein
MMFPASRGCVAGDIGGLVHGKVIPRAAMTLASAAAPKPFTVPPHDCVWMQDVKNRLLVLNVTHEGALE